MPRYAPAVTALADRLAARTLELVDIPSVSGDEKRIREHLLDILPPSLACEYDGDEAFLFVPRRRSASPLVILAGHYDTVPAHQNVPGRLADGRVHGLGSSDMKGGLAVALELVRALEGREDTAYDIALLLFGREELSAEHNPLPALFGGSRAVHEASLAILLEPTDGTVQVGCLGNVVARLTFRGRSGHSARPWTAENAIEKAVAGLAPLVSLPVRDAVVGGLTFVESLSVTRIQAGVADNVIPGEATATLSFRYAPDRTPAGAEEALQALVPAGAALEVLGNAPAAGVATGSEHVARLRTAGALAVEPKLAWTNVADFTAHGLDAVNFGPGHTAFAHRQDERVEVSALVHAYETLERFLTGAIGEDAA